MSASTTRLPDFVAPMLAKLGEPFDSDEHLFEVKWDGMRTLVYVEADGARLVNRHRHDVTALFPELEELGELEAGTLLDGELVCTVDGKPDFGRVMARRHARSPATVRSLVQKSPATFVAFDLVYTGYRSIAEDPLAARREALQRVLGDAPPAGLIRSEGIIGKGRTLFEHACSEELEGVVGKRLDSPYRVGRRSDAWIKVKRRQTALCVVLGYLPDGDRDLRSLVIAMEDEGELRAVGQVGSGLSDALRGELLELLRDRARATPLVASDADAVWVEPGVFCRVTFLERTPQGNLRAPVFEELIRGGG